MEVPKKKIVYEDRPIDLEPLEAEGAVVAPIEPLKKPLPEEKEVAPIEPADTGLHPDHKRALLIGAAPLLYGILSGNAGEGATVAGENLIAEDKRIVDKQGKDAKGTLEQKLAALRLQRELARNLREETKLKAKTAGPLERKHIVETTDDEGKPIVTTVDEALGKQAWKKSGDTDNFHLDEKMKLETHKAGLKAPNKMDAYKAAKDENELIRMYQKDSDTTKKMGEAYSRFQGTLNRPTSTANDLAVVFNFMKILDPGSVVREGEQASAANAVSVPDAVRAMYNRLLLGEDAKLPAGLREKFFNEASAMYQQQLKSQQEIDGHFKGIAERRGLDHRNITRTFPRAQADKLENIPRDALIYANKDGKQLPPINPQKLTPRMKRDLEKDGFFLRGK